MHAFRLRPILFDACIEELSHIRHEALTKSFYAALTQGGHGGVPKPIDFHAHDPQRYTGDILAWIHQACVGEREMLDAVFGLSSRAGVYCSFLLPLLLHSFSHSTTCR